MNMLSKESFTHTTAILQKRWNSTTAFYLSIFKTTSENEELPNKYCISVKLAIKY